jgi:hypothetical protein
MLSELVHEAAESAGRWLSRDLVLHLLFFLPPDRKRRVERWLRGRTETARLRRADAVVVSYGKSGRTWLRAMLSRYFIRHHGLPTERMIGFDNLHRLDPKAPRILFTHDNYIRSYTGNLDSKRDFRGTKVVLLVRHPADVAVSQYFQWKFRMRPHKKALNRYPAHDSDMSVGDFLTHADVGVPGVIGFLNGWGAERASLPQLLVVRYEDLRRDTAGELGRVLRFLGETPTEVELADCVAFASVENMRKLEEKTGSWLAGSRMKPGDKANPDSFKVRRAKVGGWRDYVDDGQAAGIEALIERELRPGFGYTAAEREPRTIPV